MVARPSFQMGKARSCKRPSGGRAAKRMRGELLDQYLACCVRQVLRPAISEMRQLEWKKWEGTDRVHGMSHRT